MFIMTSLPTSRIFYRNKLIKCYAWRYISPCEKYFSSKDIADENDSKSESNKNNQSKDEKKSSSENKLDVSTKPSCDGQKEAAKKKLFSLLAEIKALPEQQKSKPGLVLSKPLRRPSKRERFQHMEEQKKSPEKEIKIAVDEVAKSIGADPEKTKMELREKLNSLNLMKDVSEPKAEVKSDTLGIDEKLQEDIMSSVKDVASTVTAPIKSKLTQRLMRLSLEKKDESQTKISIEDMMKGMKIEKSRTESDTSRKDVAKMKPDVKPREKRIPIRPTVYTKINIFQSPPLDIFSLDVEDKEETKSKVWQSLEKKRLKLLSEFAPSNAFEEMMMWTEQGKHWKFPIDNEIDMGEEENVGFHEHVFLEHHLHGFPTRGPIRHFMELVAVGLSKNPYITVERKVENINWFRDYFKEKEDILKEYGALE